MKNVDSRTVEGFGLEWASFDQRFLTEAQKNKIFDDYFRIFPWNLLPSNAVGADIGCGSGRWANVVAPKVGFLHLVDASNKALEVARSNLRDQDNCDFIHASVAELPFDDNSLDFAYSLGVLHHVPDTAAAVASIAAKMKTGAPLLVYLYYALVDRPWWFRAMWKLSDLLRLKISLMPFGFRKCLTQIVAVLIYWPLARCAKALEAIAMLPGSWPLAYYRDKSFYVMRTDALDRLGTRLEQRFTKEQIERMFQQAGIGKIQFSDQPPFWCAVGFKEPD
jgi:SAM-dependent methyltransferase